MKQKRGKPKLGGTAFPHRWLEPAIQLPYDTEFDSIWKYQKAFDNIDWDEVLESRLEDGCPLCGGSDCIRILTPYRREVIELFPRYREGRLWIARFQCRNTKKTFSLLPLELTPYCRYTTGSMLWTLLLAGRTEGMSLFSVAEKLLDPDCRVNGSMLFYWHGILLRGFRRNHAWLHRRFDMSAVIPGGDRAGCLRELAAYCQAVGIRGPPDYNGLDAFCRSTLASNQFMFGVASQHRGYRFAS